MLIMSLLAAFQRAHANAIIDVDQDLLAAIRIGAPPPPVAARDIAMVGIVMFDAANAATGLNYHPYSYSGGAVAGASAEAAAYAAGYRMLENLFPAQTSSLQLTATSAINNLGLDLASRSISVGLGTGIANNFYAARSTDGSAVAQTPYTPGDQPGNYQFTIPTQTTVVLSGWGDVKPFAITSISSVAPPPLWGPGTPYPTEADYLASPQYLGDLRFVETHGCQACGQTQDELNLSAFWADTNGNAKFGSTETPPGHWVDIMDTVAGDAGLSLMQTARLGAMVGAALGDAGIVAWEVKNESDFWRPDTAIHFTGLGGGNDPSWQPLWPDPLFQSYISGHSTFSMAAATVLDDFFGTDAVSFCAEADPNAHDANNNPLTGAAAQRCFAGFTEAAAEAGGSRLIGGIHFASDNMQGLLTGERIGDQVAANAFTPAPEPSSLVTVATAMILFLGLVGGRQRRGEEERSLAAGILPRGPESRASAIRYSSPRRSRATCRRVSKR
ncbi:MAG: vanadium-dependent haloperoxidase [Alphaproteobacteria bacterium]|nr:vanadium-dependent haloperoxidase [Alphaproteobacteria bacterium]